MPVYCKGKGTARLLPLLTLSLSLSPTSLNTTPPLSLSLLQAVATAAVHLLPAPTPLTPTAARRLRRPSFLRKVAWNCSYIPFSYFLYLCVCFEAFSFLCNHLTMAY